MVPGFGWGCGFCLAVVLLCGGHFRRFELLLKALLPLFAALALLNISERGVLCSVCVGPVGRVPS